MYNVVVEYPKEGTRVKIEFRSHENFLEHERKLSNHLPSARVILEAGVSDERASELLKGAPLLQRRLQFVAC